MAIIGEGLDAGSIEDRGEVDEAITLSLRCEGELCRKLRIQCLKSVDVERTVDLRPVVEQPCLDAGQGFAGHRDVRLKDKQPLARCHVVD